MKNMMLMKQKLFFKNEGESPEFQQLKRDAFDMREPLKKASDSLKAWLEGAKAMQRASQDMAANLTGQDADLEAIAKTVSDGLADTNKGAGVAEVALDSINRKIGWLEELKKKATNLETLHLELARANRKVESTTDPAKKHQYQQDQERAEEAYNKVRIELEASFRFILDEARANSANGQPHPLGLLFQELAAFKQSQVAFFGACNAVTSQFQKTAPIDVHNIWTDFQDRRLSSVGKALSSPPTQRAQSGKDLLREGLSTTSTPSPTNRPGMGGKQASSMRSPPPPPPPPPPPASLSTFQALYDYEAVSSDELSIQAGARLTILDQSDPNWWMAEDAMGVRGLVPSNYLQQY